MIQLEELNDSRVLAELDKYIQQAGTEKNQLDKHKKRKVLL